VGKSVHNLVEHTGFDPVLLLMVFGTRPASPVKLQIKSPIRQWAIHVNPWFLSIEKAGMIGKVYRVKKKAPQRSGSHWEPLKRRDSVAAQGEARRPQIGSTVILPFSPTLMDVAVSHVAM